MAARRHTPESKIMNAIAKPKPNMIASEEDFANLCRGNPNLKFEQTRAGEIVTMPPTGGETGSRNADLVIDIGIWNRKTKLGKVFDSSTGFNLPIGSKRSPDLAWVSLDRWHALTTQEREKFPPIAPDFVLELLSPTDNRQEIREKMQEYLESGTRLGWLIDPKTRQVEIYRLGQNVEILTQPIALSGEDVLPNFTLTMQEFLDR
jgi:Uma2 family endonuclease